MPIKEKKPLVSIILPVYNGSKSLSACIKSLLTQTYKQIEIIAIDDHSKDESYKMLRSFHKKDKRLRIARNVKHYGLATTLNRCLRKTKGKFIAFMNTRDESKKNRIIKQLTYILAHPKTAVVGTQCFFMTEGRGRIGKSAFPTQNESIVKSLTNDITLTFESTLINTYMLPRDLLRFDNHAYPFLFTSLFAKILPFGIIENLNSHLYARVIYQKSLRSNLRESLLPSITAWVKTTVISGSRPPIRSVFFPLIKTP